MIIQGNLLHANYEYKGQNDDYDLQLSQLNVAWPYEKFDPFLWRRNPIFCEMRLTNKTKQVKVMLLILCLIRKVWKGCLSWGETRKEWWIRRIGNDDNSVHSNVSNTGTRSETLFTSSNCYLHMTVKQPIQLIGKDLFYFYFFFIYSPGKDSLRLG